MDSTRQQIISIIQTKQHSSVQELAHALNLTPQNIRHHLEILELEGVIESVGQRKTGDRGRPIQIYSLSQQIISHNLDGLVSALLQEYLSNTKSPSLENKLQRIARRMAGPAIPPHLSLTRRLYLAIQRLNEMQYLARWEAHADAPRIYFGHCPYAAILPDHPELCQVDRLLLAQLLNINISLVAKLEKDQNGLPFCLFTPL